MARTIRIRNVPEDIHRMLKARAALSGMSLSSYLLDEICRFAQRPTRDELMERLESLAPVRTRVSPAVAVRVERARRDRR
jgi:plasmid stability protein